MNNIISLKISFYAVKSLILGAEKQDVLIAPVFFSTAKLIHFFGVEVIVIEKIMEKFPQLRMFNIYKV